MTLAAHKLPIPTKFVSRAGRHVHYGHGVMKKFVKPAVDELRAQESELTEQIFRLAFSARPPDKPKPCVVCVMHVKIWRALKPIASAAVECWWRAHSGGKTGRQDRGGAGCGKEGVMATETTQATAQQPAAEQRHERQVLTGNVTSAKMDKTIVVEVQRLVQHPQVPARRAHLQKVLRARRNQASQAGRHSAHRVDPAVVQAEALAAERNRHAEQVGGRARLEVSANLPAAAASRERNSTTIAEREQTDDS